MPALDKLEVSRACLQSLLLGAALGVNGEVAVAQGALDHGDGVGALRLGVDALLRDDAGHVLEQTGKLHVALLLRNLHRKSLR